MGAITEIRDYVIWTKHLHGDLTLPARIEAMAAGEIIELEVDGVRGTWRKMDDGRDGRKTPGIRPLGSAQTFWRELYESRRGTAVAVAALNDDLPKVYPALAKTEEERKAAIKALLSAAGKGYMSDGTGWTRDEMHER